MWRSFDAKAAQSTTNVVQGRGAIITFALRIHPENLNNMAFRINFFRIDSIEIRKLIRNFI